MSHLSFYSEQACPSLPHSKAIPRNLSEELFLQAADSIRLLLEAASPEHLLSYCLPLQRVYGVSGDLDSYRLSREKSLPPAPPTDTEDFSSDQNILEPSALIFVREMRTPLKRRTSQLWQWQFV